MSMVVIGATFVDIKGFPLDTYIPSGRNAGTIEYIHGGVSRNVVENIANVELRPTFLSIVDDSPLGTAVVAKLRDHKVNTDYILTVPDGMGTWLAIFDNTGDVVGSISKRPNMLPLLDVLEQQGDAIFADADAVVLEVDLDKEIVKKIVSLAKDHGTRLFGLVSNMSIAAKRRDFLQEFDCFICNQQEAGLLFAEDYGDATPEELRDVLADRVKKANIPAMVVTMGGQGSVYADCRGLKGTAPACNVQVLDTTGAGDAFCAGVAIGLTYGRELPDAVEIGTRLAAAVITTTDNVCPRFLPEEFGLKVELGLKVEK